MIDKAVMAIKLWLKKWLKKCASLKSQFSLKVLVVGCKPQSGPYISHSRISWGFKVWDIHCMNPRLGFICAMQQNSCLHYTIFQCLGFIQAALIYFEKYFYLASWWAKRSL